MHYALFLLGFGLLVSGFANTLDDFAFRHTIQQGNVYSEEQVRRLNLGMTQAEVVQVLGSPTFIDPLQTERWDYIHRVDVKGKPLSETHLVLYFDKQQKLERIVP